MGYIVSLMLIFVSASIAALGAENPYEAAGISNPAHVVQFLDRLKRAVAFQDKRSVLAMIEYPITIYGPTGQRITYRNSTAAQSHYAQIFTSKVLEAIAAAQPGRLFSRDQGVMIGNGQVWMTERHGAMRIITINHTQ